MNKLKEEAKILNIPKRCKMDKAQLTEAIQDAKTNYKKLIFDSDDIFCKECLSEQRKQNKIDNKIYNEKLMANTIRGLIHKRIIEDGKGVNITFYTKPITHVQLRMSKQGKFPNIPSMVTL